MTMLANASAVVSDGAAAVVSRVNHAYAASTVSDLDSLDRVEGHDRDPVTGLGAESLECAGRSIRP